MLDLSIPAQTCLGTHAPINLFQQELKLYIDFEKKPDLICVVCKFNSTTQPCVQIWKSALTSLCCAALESPTTHGGVAGSLGSEGLTAV